jgi:hypothetical protein
MRDNVPQKCELCDGEFKKPFAVKFGPFYACRSCVSHIVIKAIYKKINDSEQKMSSLW